MRILILALLIIGTSAYCQQKSFPKIAFGKGVCAFYIGSGAASRHIDWTRFKAETESYRRTPFISMGFDRCILPYASNAYWGIGLHISFWAANREFTDVKDRSKENIWSNTLMAIRATHHYAYFVRAKLDMCSGVLVGTRFKYYHSKTFNKENITASSDRATFYPAFGLTFTLRYYFDKNIGFYLDGCIGYKTDALSLGLVCKMH